MEIDLNDFRCNFRDNPQKALGFIPQCDFLHGLDEAARKEIANASILKKSFKSTQTEETRESDNNIKRGCYDYKCYAAGGHFLGEGALFDFGYIQTEYGYESAYIHTAHINAEYAHLLRSRLPEKKRAAYDMAFKDFLDGIVKNQKHNLGQAMDTLIKDGKADIAKTEAETDKIYNSFAAANSDNKQEYR